MHDIIAQLDPSNRIIPVLVLLGLAFMVGLQRETLRSTGQYTIGGVRAYPLVAIAGYALAALSGPGLALYGIGFVVLGGFLIVAYMHKLKSDPDAGFATEMAALIVYLAAALVQTHELWLACGAVVATLLLLEMREKLEQFAARFPPGELFTATSFLLLCAVILPVVPNHGVGSLAINPFKIWMMVVAISGISYASYLLQQFCSGGGVLISALLGGIYSSTVTTVALARQSTQADAPRLYSGAILLASGLMYMRVGVLIFVFDRALGMELLLPLFILAVFAMGTGLLWSRGSKPAPAGSGEHLVQQSRNPLQLKSAVFFAVLFVAMRAIVQYGKSGMGTSGLYSLAVVMGLADVDPFILSLTGAESTGVALRVAGCAILIATAVNNLAKGVYAFTLAKGPTRWQALWLMSALGVLGLLSILLM